MTRLPRLDRTNATDDVEAVLRDSILSRAFRPGERLHVKRLAEQLGVSATPVKFAIDRLVSEGLVEARPRSGTFVTQVRPEDVAEVFAVRGALECLAASLFMERQTPELLRRLGQFVDDTLRPVANTGDLLQLERSNAELHAFIVAESGNARLNTIYRSLEAHSTIALVHAQRIPNAERLEKNAREHRAILDAIVAKDTGRLVKVLGDHIHEAGRALVEDLRRRSPTEDS